MSVPGEHNVMNALAAISVALQLGVSPETIQKALKKFKGAKRRFTEVGKVKGAFVIDDYAHHPTEIKATLKTAKEHSDNKVIAIFQPHRYTRTKYLMEEFAESFDQADIVILHKVFFGRRARDYWCKFKELKSKYQIKFSKFRGTCR